MSAICAVLCLNGDLVKESALAPMLAACAFRGPDATSQLQVGEVALGHLALHTTLEEVGAPSPAVDREAGLFLVLDGRLDNREDLIRSLRDDDRGWRDPPTDGDLLLAAYRRWGVECPRWLIGDFAFLLWDARRHRLLAARDPVGLRTLNYAVEGRELVLSTTVQGVLAGRRRAPEIHRDFVADLIAQRYDRWIAETAFRGVQRLPPSHLLVVDNGQLRLERYWRFGEGPRERYRRDEEYGERFVELLGEATRARLRSRGDVGLMVSGGLDSSTLACLSSRMVERGEVASKVSIYSFAFEQTPSADEKEYLAAVADYCPNLPLHRVDSDNYWALADFGADGGYPLEEPETGTVRGHYANLLRHARTNGCRVLVTGLGADQVLGADGYRTLRGLFDTPLGRLRGELPHFHRRLGLAPWRLLFLAGLGRFVPELGIEAFNRLFPSEARRPLSTSRPRTRRPRALLPHPPLASKLARLSYGSIHNGLANAGWVDIDRINGWVGVDVRHPYLDRRVVDFLLGLPPGMLLGQGWRKDFLRRSVGNLLPPKVAKRRNAADLGDLSRRGYDEEYARIAALMDDPLVVRHGFVEEGYPSKIWSGFQRFGFSHGWERALAVFLCAESWLRYQSEQVPRPMVS